MGAFSLWLIGMSISVCPFAIVERVNGADKLVNAAIFGHMTRIRDSFL
jgi:hypothetical protein